MKLGGLFSGEHADYYAERAFGLGRFGVGLGSSVEMIEILASLNRRIGALEDQVAEFYQYMPILEQLAEEGGTTTVLDSIAGLGKQRKQSLLREFGSLDRIRDASIEELCEVPGIGPVLAQRIKKMIAP
jgi:ERCC4-type nuclease